MAQTFTVSKERSTPGTRKHRTPVVVSAQPKTPITVSPPQAQTAKVVKTVGKTTKTQVPETAPLPLEVTPQLVASPDVQVRKRGRPRKVALDGGTASAAPDVAASTVARASSAKLKRTRQHRVTGTRLLDAERASGGGKVPLAARRIVEQLQALLARASVEAFRGKKDRPSVTLSKLEEQAIQEALILFQLKVSLQRGVEPRQLRVS